MPTPEQPLDRKGKPCQAHPVLPIKMLLTEVEKPRP